MTERENRPILVRSLMYFKLNFGRLSGKRSHQITQIKSVTEIKLNTKIFNSFKKRLEKRK